MWLGYKGYNYGTYEKCNKIKKNVKNKIYEKNLFYFANLYCFIFMIDYHLCIVSYTL